MHLIVFILLFQMLTEKDTNIVSLLHKNYGLKP